MNSKINLKIILKINVKINRRINIFSSWHHLQISCLSFQTIISFNLSYSILFHSIVSYYIISPSHLLSCFLIAGLHLLILGKSNLVHISQLLELVVAIENMYVHAECTIREYHIYSVSAVHTYIPIWRMLQKIEAD